MSRSLIKSYDHLIRKIGNVQELLMRQKAPDMDVSECIADLDSCLNTLHGIRQEEIEIVRFERPFLESQEDEDEYETEE